MERTLRKLAVWLLIFTAALTVSVTGTNAATKKAKAKAKVSAKSAVDTSGDFWEVEGSNLKFTPSDGTNIKNSFIQLPKHYKFTKNGQLYRVVGGCWYVDKNGFLAIMEEDTKVAAPYYTIDAAGKATRNGTIGRIVRAKMPKDGASFDDENLKLYWKDGTKVRDKCSSGNYYTDAAYTKALDEDSIIFIKNASSTFTGIVEDSDGEEVVIVKGATSNGRIMKNGILYQITDGKIGSPYSGGANQQYEYPSLSITKFSATTYFKDGKPVSGWNVSDESYAFGCYNSNGTFNVSKNNWIKHSGKWYFLEKGKIYRPNKTKAARAGKLISSTGLRCYSDGSKASTGKFYYYFNKDGSLVDDVFKVDKTWKKNKKMRIFVNLKAGVDNVTFMGWYKGGYTVPLKTVVNSSSKKASVRKGQMRGKKGRGFWYLAKTSKARKRWFVFKKDGHRYYYQWATTILGTGALFHSARYLRAYNNHSLYTAHFNAMGRSNITTKCVRLEAENAKLVYDLSTNENTYKITVKFISKGKGKKNSYMPFGHKRLKDSTPGTNSWHKNYDPSDPSL